MTTAAPSPPPILSPAALAVAPHTLREAWLQAAVEALRPLFLAKKHTIPACQVSCGFASSGLRSGHIGQCWSTQSSEDARNQIFISPALSDSVAVLDTLVHELIHAVDNCAHKHGKEFKKMALGLGLKGPMRSAGAGPELKAKLQGIALALGPYPHARLKVANKKAPSRKRALARCAGCGYQVPMLRKFLSFGPPICPQHKVAMEPLGDWEED